MDRETAQECCSACKGDTATTEPCPRQREKRYLLSVLPPPSSLWARSPTGEPIWEPVRGSLAHRGLGSATCDTKQSRGRGEMDPRANRPVTSLRVGNEAVPKTQGPEISWLSPP